MATSIRRNATKRIAALRASHTECVVGDLAAGPPAWVTVPASEAWAMFDHVNCAKLLARADGKVAIILASTCYVLAQA